jgi:hypothetical protein
MTTTTQMLSLRRRRSNERERGAAMLVVMLVLLVVTATATMAVQSSQFEIRAAGQARQAMQTRQVAVSGIETVTATIEMRGGARMLEFQMNRAPQPLGTRLAVTEPPLSAVNNRNQRFVSSEFLVGGTMGVLESPASPASYASFGRSAYEPHFIVDVNDVYDTPALLQGAAAGTRLDGNGSIRLQFLVATMTSRGRMARSGLLDARGGYATGLFTAPEAGRLGHLRADVFETSATVRAITISGPYVSM